MIRLFPHPGLCAAVALVCCAGVPAVAEETPLAAPDMAKAIQPMMEEYCFDCHNEEKQKGDINLVDAVKSGNVADFRDIWERVLDVVESGDMPPEKKPQLPEGERASLMQFLAASFTATDCVFNRNPGRVTLRRLNRDEYRNTIRDLVGVDFVANEFPTDDVGYGFDNIGDVLSVSPLLMEKLMAAAEEISQRAIITDPEKKDLPASHRKLIPKLPAPGEEHAVAKELLAPIVRRAYRRAVTDEELERVTKFVDLAMANGGQFTEGMQVAVQAILCSPQFLFRWELDHPDAGAVRELTDFEVASRLSYFLWNTMPDDPLLALAEKGELRKDDNLRKQVIRMLADWRCPPFMKNFADQWLQLRNIWDANPDLKLFPKWDNGLKDLMVEEGEKVFATVVKEDRNIYDLVSCDFTFLNEKLARFYGIPGVTGKEMRKVQLPPDSPRGGVLTLGGVLLATSTPTRTAPVIRGKWILEQILGTPPPPAPPNVPPLDAAGAVNQALPLRQRLEQHSSQPACSSCHKRMDPLGFALENFDAIGAWRTEDGKFPVDASGKLPNGKTFDGPVQLKEVLKSGRGFAVNLTEKLLTYALGRGLEPYDRCAVDAIVTQISEKDYRFSELIVGIVTSEPFLRRQTEGPIAKN